jgi:hypothetical protein
MPTWPVARSNDTRTVVRRAANVGSDLQRCRNRGQAGVFALDATPVELPSITLFPPGCRRSSWFRMGRVAMGSGVGQVPNQHRED